jgi:hypothetical protein
MALDRQGRADGVDPDLDPTLRVKGTPVGVRQRRLDAAKDVFEWDPDLAGQLAQRL